MADETTDKKKEPQVKLHTDEVQEDLKPADVSNHPVAKAARDEAEKAVKKVA